MNNEFNYESNIFYIVLIIQSTRKACSLEIDPELYLDKIVEDILFIDKILKLIMENLHINSAQMHIERHLRNLYLAKRDLVLLLDDLRSNTLPFAQFLEQYNDRFTHIVQGQKADMAEIDDRLNFEEHQIDKKNMISEDEYSVLFDSE